MKQTIERATWILMVTVILPLHACKKDKDDKSPAKTKTELLTTGSWKLTAFTVNPAIDIDGDGTKETDLFSKTPGCIRDNFTIYKTNGEGEDNEGPTKCDPANPQVKKWTWNFNSDETHLLVDGVDYTIQELTASMLKLTDMYFDPGSFVLLYYELTFSH